jgi:hypothetical protein
VASCSSCSGVSGTMLESLAGPVPDSGTGAWSGRVPFWARADCGGMTAMPTAASWWIDSS